MSIIEYGTRISGNRTFATYSKNGFNFEIPIKPDYTEEDIQNKIESTVLTKRLEVWNGRTEEDSLNKSDKLYHNKSLAREDYTVGSVKGKALVAKLQEKYPNYANWTRSNKNAIGEFEGYREPYKNHSITWYDIGVNSSLELLSEYKVGSEEDNITSIRAAAESQFGWYSLKFDLVTDEVILKVGYNDIANKPESLPNNIWYYAVTYMPDGTVSDWVDVYSHETESYMRKFCEDHNLEWPLPDDFDGGVLLWGLLFNKTTLEYKSVKAYTCDIL